MIRLLDDRGRLFGRVNIVDVLVLVAIVAIVVFAAVRLAGGGAESVPVKITFLDTRVEHALVPGMQAKGTIRDTSGNIIGELQSVEVSPSIEQLLTTEGEYRTFPSNIRSDVSFVVLCEGTISDSTVRVGRLAARVGAEVRIVGPGYEAQTVISDVVWGAEALQ